MEAMGEACMTQKEMRNTIKIFVGKPEGETPFVICKPRWKYNIKIDLKEIG